MIGFLKGQVIECNTDGLILDVNGVGYEVSCSQNTLGESVPGQIKGLWIHTHVREDAFHLFGFSSKTEKELFLSLIKVSGVGPKLGITILSGASLHRLIEMIEASDVKGLMNLPKVGKKTAEQLILSLKGKLVLADDGDKKNSSESKRSVTSALVNLGFRVSDVEEAVKSMPQEITVEDGVRRGLQLLTGG